MKIHWSKFFLYPYLIVIITTLTSFLFWLVPDFDRSLRKGFDKNFDITFSGLLMCFLWLFSIIVFSFSGFFLAKKLKFNTSKLDTQAPFSSYDSFLWLCAISFIGVLYVLVILLKELGISGMIDAITGSQANTLKDILYSNYSIGLASLRYISIPTASLGMYHLTKHRYYALSFMSIALLLITSVISS